MSIHSQQCLILSVRADALFIFRLSFINSWLLFCSKSQKGDFISLHIYDRTYPVWIEKTKNGNTMCKTEQIKDKIQYNMDEKGFYIWNLLWFQ